MNSKKSGWLFLIVVVVYLGVQYLLSYLMRFLPIRGMSFEFALFFGETLMLVPTLLFLLFNRSNPLKVCRFHKIKISTALMTVLFAFLAIPAATLMNILSMFFVENTVSQMSPQMLNTGFGLCFLAIAVYGPFVEEVVFRGAIFGGMRESASVWKSMLLSALLFGMMHMNFNQVGYAFVLGISMALLVEATGSIWASIIFHITVNARSVIALFGVEKLSGLSQDLAELLGQTDVIEAAEATVTNSQLAAMLCLELLVAVVCLPIAGCVLVFLAKRENRLERLKSIWVERRQGKVFGIPVIIGMIICVVEMVLSVL